MRLKALAAFCLTLLFVAVCALPGDPARAQRRGRPAQGAQNTAQPAAQQERPKQVIIGRGSDTARGSRMTITSDNPLNDYSAYRSGDRFYVELPNANAEAAARAAGKGFSDLQVQRRGKNVVLSYRVAPGAKPRVEQRFNRLEVVFEVPEGEAARTAPQQPQQAAAGQNQGTQGQPSGQAATPNANPTREAERRTAAENAAANQTAGAAQTPPSNNASTAAAQPPAAEQTVPVGETAPPAAQPSPVEGQPAPQEVAQVQPPAPVAPVTTTNTAAPAASGTSIGAVLWNNWPIVLIATLLLAGIGLLLAGRRASATTPAPAVEGRAAAPVAPLEPSQGKPAAEASLTNGKTGAAAVAAASLVAASTAARESKKAGKKAKKRARAAEAAGKEQRTLAEEQRTLVGEKQTPVEVQETPVAERVEEPAAGLASAPEPEVPVVEAPSPEEVTAGEVAAQEVTVETSPAVVEAPAETSDRTAEVAAVVAGAAAIGAGAETKTEEVPTEAVAEEVTVEVAPAEVEVKDVVALEPTAPEAKGIAPLVAFDADRTQAETKRLLEGEDYDRAVLSTRDAMARQLIAAELLSALAGRNAERRARARAAFVEHGYFDEAAQDLRTASASAERSSAARALGLAADRAATPHLVAALEDPAIEVRRAAVESLASLRDPAAVAPLEALLRREKKSRDKVNRKLVEHSIQVSREGEDELPAPEEKAVEAVPQPQAAPAAEVATETAVEPVYETAVEPAEPAAEVVEWHAPTAVEEEAPATSEQRAGGEAETASPVEEVASPAELLESAEPVRVGEAVESGEAVGAVEPAEPAPSSTEVEVYAGSPSADDQSFAASPYVFESRSAVEESEEVAEPAAGEVSEEAPASRVFTPEFAPSAESESPTAGPATLFEESEATPAEIVAEEAPVAFVDEAPSGVGESREARGRRSEEWVELDISELSTGAPPAPAAPDVFVFETSGGEPVAPEASADAPASFEPEPATVEVAETGLEVTESPAVEEVPAYSSPSAAAAPTAFTSPAGEGEEKGVAPFDEFSSVPANIQQRLASRDPEERAGAVAELARVDPSEAFQQVCAAFDDESKEVRSAAARTLYELQGDRAESFTRALREAPPDRRRNIGAAIAASGLAGDAIGQLTGESREKTYEAFSLLFLMAKAGEVAPLIRAIEGHPNSEVRLAVVKLLALSGQKEILPAFRRLAVRGSLPTEVRSAVMEAIYQISSQSETSPAA